MVTGIFLAFNQWPKTKPPRPALTMIVMLGKDLAEDLGNKEDKMKPGMRSHENRTKVED